MSSHFPNHFPTFPTFQWTPIPSFFFLLFNDVPIPPSIFLLFLPFNQLPFPHSLSYFSITFPSPIHFYEELVVQNLRREPHSSVTVRRFRKLKSCCYVIAIPSDWHCCPNPNCNARFWSKKRWLHHSPSMFPHTVSHSYNPSANQTQSPRVES